MGRLAARGWVTVSLLLGAACTPQSDTLIPEDWIVGDAIVQPLADIAGDPSDGARIFIDRDRGHCVLCHAIDGLDAEFQGNVGPTLTHIGDRLSPEQIRLRIADIARLHPETVMPSYYRIEGLTQVPERLAGQPVLSSRDIEHLIAYLSTQTAP